jgi:hypothetical protein
MNETEGASRRWEPKGVPPAARTGRRSGSSPTARRLTLAAVSGGPSLRKSNSGDRPARPRTPTSGPDRLLPEVATLLADTYEAASGDERARALLREARERLDQPLRVALAGKVKAGKSTLLNALVGEELAPTDARECTKVVTWYGDGVTYQVTVHRRDGASHQVPFRRREGGLEVQLGMSLDEVDHLEVTWPSKRLAQVALIDTPGIGSISAEVSARTYDFLDNTERAGSADAVIYLLRHLHSTDVRFLEAFHDEELSHGTPINTLGVLSRADEIGACRMSAMDAARRVAARYRSDTAIRRLCQTVVPVAGLVAQASVTLREEEYRHLAALAGLSAERRVALLLTADRFVAEDASVTVPAAARAALVERLGLYGVRLAVELAVSGRAPSSTALAAALYEGSGMTELSTALAERIGARSRVLKARSALAALNQVLGPARWPTAAALRARQEQILSSAHEIAEVRLLNDLWLGHTELPDEHVHDLERLLGGLGTTVAERLGAEPGTPVEGLRAMAAGELQRWSRRAEHPLSSASVKAAARTACRTCEGILVELPAGPGDQGVSR